MSPRVAAAVFLLLTTLCAVAGCGHKPAHSAGSSATAPAIPGADLARGKLVYEAQCAACHGAHGVGGPVGPALQNENTRRSYRSVYAIVNDPSPPMPKLYPSRLTKSDLRDVSAYVETL